MDKATPRPWRTTVMDMSKKDWALLHRRKEGIPVATYKGNVIAAFWCATDRAGEDIANRDFVQRAVNSHDQLIEALLNIANTSLADPASVEGAANCMIETALEAIKAAKGDA